MLIIKQPITPRVTTAELNWFVLLVFPLSGVVRKNKNRAKSNNGISISASNIIIVYDNIALLASFFQIESMMPRSSSSSTEAGERPSPQILSRGKRSWSSSRTRYPFRARESAAEQLADPAPDMIVS